MIRTAQQHIDDVGSYRLSCLEKNMLSMPRTCRQASVGVTMSCLNLSLGPCPLVAHPD